MRFKTPQYRRQVVDIRVAVAKRMAIRFLEDLGIDHERYEALDLARDIIVFYDPTNPQREDYEKLETVMRKYEPLTVLIPLLKQQGMV